MPQQARQALPVRQIADACWKMSLPWSFSVLVGEATNMAALRAAEKQGQIFYSKRRRFGFPFGKRQICKSRCGRKRCRGCALPPQSMTLWRLALRLGFIRRHSCFWRRVEGGTRRQRGLGCWTDGNPINQPIKYRPAGIAYRQDKGALARGSGHLHPSAAPPGFQRKYGSPAGCRKAVPKLSQPVAKGGGLPPGQHKSGAPTSAQTCTVGLVDGFRVVGKP